MSVLALVCVGGGGGPAVETERREVAPGYEGGGGFFGHAHVAYLIDKGGAPLLLT